MSPDPRERHDQPEPAPEPDEEPSEGWARSDDEDAPSTGGHFPNEEDER